jgi:hypothetical protein
MIKNGGIYQQNNMKHLKTYNEAINFNFDENDRAELDREEISIMDQKLMFTDFEEEFFEAAGFTRNQQYIGYYQCDHEGFNITIQKQFNDNRAYYICCVAMPQQQYIPGGAYNPYTYDQFNVPLENTTEEERIKILKKILRRIYVFTHMEKRQADRKLKKQGIKKPKGVIGPDDEEWWNLPT